MTAGRTTPSPPVARSPDTGPVIRESPLSFMSGVTRPPERSPWELNATPSFGAAGSGSAARKTWPGLSAAAKPLARYRWGNTTGAGNAVLARRWSDGTSIFALRTTGKKRTFLGPSFSYVVSAGTSTPQVSDCTLNAVSSGPALLAKATFCPPNDTVARRSDDTTGQVSFSYAVFTAVGMIEAEYGRSASSLPTNSSGIAMSTGLPSLSVALTWNLKGWPPTRGQNAPCSLLSTSSVLGLVEQRRDAE